MPHYPALYCPGCHKQQTLKMIWTIPEMCVLVGLSRWAIEKAMRKGLLKYRYRYKDGKAHKVSDYYQFWDYITATCPTPEELKDGGVTNGHRKAIQKYLDFYAYQWKRKMFFKAQREQAAADREQDEPSV